MILVRLIKYDVYFFRHFCELAGVDLMKFGVVLFVALFGFFSGHSYSSEQDPANEIVSQVTKLDNPQLADSAAFVSHDLSPWGMYLAADVIVKTVMIGLLLASIVCWGIFIAKLIYLNKSKREGRALLVKLLNSHNLKMAEQGLTQEPSTAKLLIQACLHELILSSNNATTSDALKERVAARLDRVKAELSADMNKGTGVLATIGSVAPFVGLFGTVWGIMNSFISIAKTQTTNLAVVAPGIAEALLATALGLVAAIPAVVMYNYFSRSITAYKSQLLDTVTVIMTILSRDLSAKDSQAKPLEQLIDYQQIKAAGK